MSTHNEATKLMIIWNGWNHTLPITAPPTCVDGVLVVHVDNESMRDLLEADRIDFPNGNRIVVRNRAN